MLAIVDYGVGNLFSLQSSFAAVGEAAVVSSDPAVLRAADRLILPGVGAFRDAAEKLRQSGLDEIVRERTAAGTPLLGICLGMQLLFDNSLEYGDYPGLGLIPGSVRPIAERVPAEYKIPHIGWNALRLTGDNPLFHRIQNGDCVYFVHSYHAVCEEKYISADTEYGGRLTAAVRRDNIYGCQFHPEKSGRVGLAILKSFCEDT